jgi:hypothetical protein
MGDAAVAQASVNWLLGAGVGLTILAVFWAVLESVDFAIAAARRRAAGRSRRGRIRGRRLLHAPGRAP